MRTDFDDLQDDIDEEKTTVDPPATLSEEAQAVWRSIASEYDIDDAGGIAVLNAACESFDRMRQAAAIVNAEGMVVADRFGQSKPHPATIIERDARAAYLSGIKQLRLDDESDEKGGKPVGRPMGS